VGLRLYFSASLESAVIGFQPLVFFPQNALKTNILFALSVLVSAAKEAKEEEI